MTPHLTMRWLQTAGVILGLAGPWAQARLSIVATTPDLGSIAALIGGTNVSIITLARPTEDPHFLDPKPSFIVRLNRADLLIEGGADLEIGWLPPLLERARNPKLAPGALGRLAAAAGLDLLEVPEQLDRAQGDVHAAGNPHFLLDPLNAGVLARRLAGVLSRLDPERTESYRVNLESFERDLAERMTAWQKLLEPHRGRRLVSYHNIWPYFARRFGLRIDLFLEPKPGIPPTPRSLSRVISEMKAEGIGVILIEPFQNRHTAERVARATGAAIVEVTQYPGGVKGTEGGYLEMLEVVIRSIAEGLSRDGAPAP